MPSCGDCFFGLDIKGRGEPTSGVACRRAPKPVSKSPGDWCGEYRPRPALEQHFSRATFPEEKPLGEVVLEM